MMPEALTAIHQSSAKSKTSSPKVVKKGNLVKNYSNLNVTNATKPQVLKRGNSFVVGQKLRESKWFSHNEEKVFCAVVESGFIVEKKEIVDETSYGLVIWTPGNEKSKNPDHLQIYTLSGENGKTKVVALKLDDFWPQGTTIRINNKNDKTETPLEETVIRHQISYAQHSKRKWHNSEHFTYFCRYGPVENSKRIMDHLKWNTGSLFQKIKSLSIK